MSEDIAISPAVENPVPQPRSETSARRRKHLTEKLERNGYKLVHQYRLADSLPPLSETWERISRDEKRTFVLTGFTSLDRVIARGILESCPPQLPFESEQGTVWFNVEPVPSA